MNELDRYLRQVGFWLPRRQRADILRELRGVLEDLLAAAESEAGRPLDPRQARAALSRFGLPALVASRYASRRPVVSPALSHAFWRVLAISLAGALLAQAVVLSIRLAVGAAPATALGFVAGKLFVVLPWTVTLVLFAFVLLDRICVHRADASSLE